MYLPSMHAISSTIAPADAYNYAPPAGRQTLRERWREKLARREPVAARQVVRPADRRRARSRTASRSRAISSSTRAIASCCRTSSGATTGSPTKCGSAPRSRRSRSTPANGFHTEAFAKARRGERAGPRQADRAAELPEQPDRLHADAGRRARDRRRARGAGGEGHEDRRHHRRRVLRSLLSPRRPSMTESLFGLLTDRHPNLLAVKLDGATKELFVWGLRCGFITLRSRAIRRAPRSCARCSTPRRAARSAARSRTARSSRRRWSRRRSTPRRSPTSARRRPRRCARAPRRSTKSCTARVPRELRAVPVQQRLLHVRQGEGRRRREAARAPARRAPDRPDRDEPRPTSASRSRASSCDADRAALRDAAPGDPELRDRRAIRARRASGSGAYRALLRGCSRPSSGGCRARGCRSETRSFGPWMPRVSLGGSQRGTKPYDTMPRSRK